MLWFCRSNPRKVNIIEMRYLLAIYWIQAVDIEIILRKNVTIVRVLGINMDQNVDTAYYRWKNQWAFPEQEGCCFNIVSLMHCHLWLEITSIILISRLEVNDLLRNILNEMIGCNFSDLLNCFINKWGGGIRKPHTCRPSKLQ